MLELRWSTNAWEDYLYWQKISKKDLKKINELIKDIQRNHLINPATGIGKPEQLKHLGGEVYSRRINEKDRLVYKVENNLVYILQARYHY